MKELSIEGKATRYDQAIKVAKSKIKNDKDHVLYEDDVIEIFPELKESEDERIRGAIIDHLKDNNLTEWAAWLEKQGEHKKFLSKIQVGDKVTRNEDGVLVNLSQLKRIAKPAEEYNITGIGSKNAQGKLGEMIRKLKPVNEVWEQKFADKVEPKFKQE